MHTAKEIKYLYLYLCCFAWKRLTLETVKHGEDAYILDPSLRSQTAPPE